MLTDDDRLRESLEIARDVRDSPLVANALGHAAAAFTTSGFAAFGVLLVVAALLGRRQGVADLAATVVLGLVAACLAAGIGLTMKNLTHEARPCQIDPSLARWSTCPPPGSWSFPSNHAVFAAVAATTLVLVARHVHRTWIGTAAAVVAVAIGGSRVVLGVHFWYDVVGGLVLGATVTLALFAAARRLPNRVGPHRRRRLDRVAIPRS